MLAGGRSERFGRDKLWADLHGEPLVLRAIAAVSAVCDDVVVVLAPDADAGVYPAGVVVTHDPTEGEGPLAGLHAGLMAAVRSDMVLVAGGDMPELQPEVLRLMLDALDGEHAPDAVALHDGERARPLPLALRTWPAADAAHTLLHAGRRRLRDVVDTMRSAVVPAEVWEELDPEQRTLRDIDTTEDLEG